MSIHPRICLFVAGYCMLLLGSCSSFEELEEEPVKQVSSPLGVPMRTMVCISKCVDYYVTVGSYTEYKGTRCWNEYYSIGGGGGEYSGGEYNPGNFNIGNGTIENKSFFTFNRLEELYGSRSNLNMEEKAILNSLLNSIHSSCQLYQDVYSLFTRSNIKIDFIIDPNIGYPAYYLNKTIKIRNIKQLDIFNFTEEFLHSIQDLCFYHEQMEPSHKNCEFEAKVFQDLVNTLYSENIGLRDIPLITDERPEFGELYREWMEELINKKCFNSGDQTYFNYLCKEWQGYKGNFNPNFSPKLLLHFFSKPPVEHK